MWNKSSQYSNTHCGAEFVSMGWQYSYKGMPVFSNIWQCSYVLARLESAWELWGLRTLNIEARHFARLPQLLHNGVALSKRLGLKHRAQSSCKAHGCLCSPVTCRNIALGVLAVIQVWGRWGRWAVWDEIHQSWDFYLADSMSQLISAASLYNHWKEIGTFQEQFIWLISSDSSKGDCFGIQHVAVLKKPVPLLWPQTPAQMKAYSPDAFLCPIKSTSLKLLFQAGWHSQGEEAFPIYMVSPGYLNGIGPDFSC